MGTLAVLTRTDGVVRLLKREYRAAVAWLNGTRSGRELKRAGAALLVGGGVLVIGAAWVLPFLLGPATGAGGRSPWLVPDRTGWSGFLLVHGWVLAVFVAFFAVRATDWDRSSETAGWMAVAGVAALGVLAVLLDAAAFAFLLPLFLFGWVTLRRSDALGFESVLFVAGAGLVLLVEVIYLKEQAGPGRLNTVFKTYMQVWILWATATGAALAILIPGRPLLAAMDGAAAGLSAEDPGGDSKRLRGQAAAVLSVLLVVSMSMYGVFALGAHFEDAPEPSLDATAYVEESRPTEAPAIAWLDDREGKPTIVTAAPGGYRWSPRTGRGASAPSSLTGVPTVLGWFHERGYRGTGPYQQRLAEVETIYTGAPGERAALLAEHDVEYVYAGPAERAEYGEANVSEFSTMEGVSLARSWSPEMTIYRVDQSALAAS